MDGCHAAHIVTTVATSTHRVPPCRAPTPPSPSHQVGLPLWVPIAQLVSLAQIVLIWHLLLDLLILQDVTEAETL
jgi:hypothetical protein